MKKPTRVIFHIDLNQFFCSVATIKNPRLKGKAFAIGRENSMKGVISTASYEARAHGVHAGMSQVDAYRAYPDLLIVSYPFELYHEYSRKFFHLLHEYVKDIEQASIDEGYLDVTDITVNIGRHPLDLAKEIQKRAYKELSLPCSIGIGPTLFLAKMASDMKKPLGITILRVRDVKDKLYPLPVKDIFGIGKKTWPKLMDNGIKTIGDFINNKEKVIKLIGENSYNYVSSSLEGKTEDKVDPYRFSDQSSISHSQTFDTPIYTYEECLKFTLELAEYAYSEMVRDKKKARTINITMRDTDFNTITRAKSLDIATNNKTLLLYYVEDLVEQNYQGKPLRLVGAGFSNLFDVNEIDYEITLFNYEDVYGKENAIKDLMDKYKGVLYFGKNKKL